MKQLSSRGKSALLHESVCKRSPNPGPWVFVLQGMELLGCPQLLTEGSARWVQGLRGRWLHKVYGNSPESCQLGPSQAKGLSRNLPMRMEQARPANESSICRGLSCSFSTHILLR